MTVMHRLFAAHPETVGETYVQHLAHAAWFAGMLAWAAGACLLHAIVPCACEKTGSRIITRLHDRMVVNRVKPAVVQADGAVTRTA